MILGIGIDLVEIYRIEHNLNRLGVRFTARIGRAAELKAAPKTKARQAEYWAGRFAAKEAFAKALGTGIGSTVPFRSVGIVKSKTGKPALEFSKALTEVLKKRGITSSHVSITHTGGVAAAVVILERA